MRKPRKRAGNAITIPSAGNPKPVVFIDEPSIIVNDNAGNDFGAAIVFDPTDYSGHSEQVGATEQSPASDEPGRNPIDPATGKRRRGRPPGGGTRNESRAPVAISGIEKLLLGIHTTLAASLSIPEFEMDQAEASEIAKAYADVAEYYPVLKMSGETAALVNFASIVGVNYGARFMAFKMRRSLEKRAARSQPQQAPMPQDVQMPVGPPRVPNAAPATKPTVTNDVRTGEIPGVGAIEFPQDHPLMGGKKVFHS